MRFLTIELASAESLGGGQLDSFQNEGESNPEVGDQRLFIDVLACGESIPIQEDISYDIAAFRTGEQIGAVAKRCWLFRRLKFIRHSIAKTQSRAQPQKSCDGSTNA